MRSSSLSVAVAQPQIELRSLAANVAAHVRAIQEAGSRLVVFPEMSLTGYDLDEPVVELDDPVLAELVAACAEAGSVALVGAPVAEGDRHYIATLRIDSTGVAIAYRKTWLHGSEEVRFTPGHGADTTEVDGWVVGLAICRDTGQSQHTVQLARHDVDLYAAGVVDVPADVIECQARAFVISRALNAPVAIASFAGPTGGGFAQTAGHSAIFSASGAKMVEADGMPGGVVGARVAHDAS